LEVGRGRSKFAVGSIINKLEEIV